jgi:outer membrane protein TolC
MKRVQSLRIWLLTIVILGLLLPCFADAQKVTLQQQDARKQLFLSLEEAISLALQNNLDIRVQQYDPEMKKEDIKNAEAAFAFNLSSGSTETLNSESLRSSSTPKDSTVIQAGIEKRTQIGGGYQLTLKTSRAAYDQTLNNQTVYGTNLQLQVSQSLLKNRGTTVNTASIVIARKNRDISLSELRAQVVTTVAQVQNTYWQLVFALRDLETKQHALQLAYDQVRINEAQVKVGTLAPIEVLQAQTTAAMREVEIINAQKTIRDDEDQLKRLLNISGDDPIWQAAITPTDTPLSTKQAVSLDESIQLALKNREELFKLQKAIEVQEFSVNVSQNQLLPQLDLVGSMGLTGSDTAWGGSLGDLTKFDKRAFTIGANLSYPLGNNAAKSSLNKAKLQLDQTKLSVQNLEQQLIVQVRQAVRAVESSYQAVEATKVARQLAEKQLDAEQKKFQEGLSTNFQVLTYQDSLAKAQSSEIQAITGYNQALVALDQATGVILQKHNITIGE